MIETEFRFKHSQLMEYYQYVEWRLKAICATLFADGDNSWFDLLDKYEQGMNTMGRLLARIREYGEENGEPIMSEADFAELEKLKQNRNYWCHLAFGGNDPIAFKKKCGAKEKYVKPVHGIRLEEDLSDAVEWDEKLTDISRHLEKRE